MENVKINITKRDVVKTAIGWVVGGCVGFVTTTIIKGAIEPESRKEEIKLYVGAAAISMVAKEVVQKSIDQKVDMIADAYNNAKMEVGLQKILTDAEENDDESEKDL